MPNYVTNKIDFYGDNEDIKAVMDMIKGQDERTRAIDFDRLIPMPEELNIEDGSGLYEAMDVYLTLVNPNVVTWHRGLEKLDDCDFTEIMRQYRRVAKYAYGNVTMTASEVDAMVERLIDNNDLGAVINKGRQGISNLMKYGAVSEYDWHCDHWGTKWNAYNQSVESDSSISFDTAWSIPEPILQKLAVICDEYNVWLEGQFVSEDWRQYSGWYASYDDVLNVWYDETEDEGAERANAVWGCDPRNDEE